MQTLMRIALLAALLVALPVAAQERGSASGHVDLTWVPTPPQPDALTVKADGRALSIDGPHRRMQATLLRAFDAATLRFRPPLVLTLVVQQFSIRARQGGHEALLELVVLDRRDRYVLSRGILRQSLALSTAMQPGAAVEALQAGLDALVAQAVDGLLNRLGGGETLPPGARRHWLGVQVGIPAPAAFAYRWRLGQAVDLELGATPGWPGFGASLGGLARLYERRNLVFHLGLSAGTWRPQDYLATCAVPTDDDLVDASSCERSPPALLYAQTRLGVVWLPGADGAHGLGADFGYAAGLAWKPSGAARWLGWPNVGVSWFLGF